MGAPLFSQGEWYSNRASFNSKLLGVASQYIGAVGATTRKWFDLFFSFSNLHCTEKTEKLIFSQFPQITKLKQQLVNRLLVPTRKLLSTLLSVVTVDGFVKLPTRLSDAKVNSIIKCSLFYFDFFLLSSL